MRGFLLYNTAMAGHEVLNSITKKLRPAALVLLLASCGTPQSQPNTQDICSLGTNVIDNTHLLANIATSRNQTTGQKDCKIPVTMMFRERDFFDNQFYVQSLEYAKDYDMFLTARIAENENNGNNWKTPDPTTVYSLGERIAQLAKNQPTPLHLIAWNEPNIHAEWGGQANPEGFADVLVALINGLGDNTDKVKFYMPPLSYCNGKCSKVGIEPKEYYQRLYKQLETKLTQGIDDPGYKRLITQQWIAHNFQGFAVNIYPTDSQDAVRQIKLIIDLLHSSGLVNQDSAPKFLISEIGLPGGKMDSSAGQYACTALQAMQKALPQISFIENGATVFAREDGVDKKTNTPRQLGFYSQNCSNVITLGEN